MIRVGFLLYNAMTCMQQRSHMGAFFGLEPPTLEQYFDPAFMAHDSDQNL